MGYLTPWFPGDVKPKRKGVYERDFWGFGDSFFYSLWDGKKWHSLETTPFFAARDKFQSAHQRLPWRGLAKEPK